MRPFLFPALLALSSLAAAGQSLDARIRSRAEAKMAEFQKESGFPGMTFAWELADGRRGSLGFGVADKDSGAKMSEASRMLAGSTGKTFFAAWILQLVEEGVLDLDKPISEYIGKEPWFARVPNAKDLTLRLLMRHQSGIQEMISSEALIEKIKADPDKWWKPEEVIAFVFDLKPLFPAGEGWSYADMNFILASIVAEKVSGKNAYDEIKRRFLVPLGLNDTIPSNSRTLTGLVQGHVQFGAMFTGGDRFIKDGKTVIHPGFEWAGGGFVSSSRDLAHWAQALFGGKVLKPETSAMQKQGVAAPQVGGQYGLGVQIWNEAGGPGYGHGGFFPGYLTEVELMPSGVAVAVQFNADGGRELLRNRRRYLAELTKIVEEEIKR